jgi:adenosylcobinamide-phosphate synthase
MIFAWHLPTALIAVAALMDLLLGDPAWMPHPVRLIGKLIALGERMLWTGDPGQDLRRGVLLMVRVIVVVIAVTWTVVVIGESLAPVLGAAVAVIVAWTTLALRGLDAAAATVQTALERDDLAAGAGGP